MLKHFLWNDSDNGSGRVGVLLEGDTLEVFRVSGKAMPASALLGLLRSALQAEDIERATQLHNERQYCYVVERFYGMSGAQNIILRYLQDERRGIVRRGGALHISMYGKLNEDWVVWLGDVPPILAEAKLPRETPCEFEGVEIRAAYDWQWCERESLAKILSGQDDDEEEEILYLGEQVLAKLRIATSEDDDDVT